jgi:hypothetical protein
MAEQQVHEATAMENTVDDQEGTSSDDLEERKRRRPKPKPRPRPSLAPTPTNCDRKTASTVNAPSASTS